MLVWHCVNALECVHSLLRIHAFQFPDDPQNAALEKAARLENALTLVRRTDGNLEGLLFEEGIVKFLAEAIEAAKQLQLEQLPKPCGSVINFGRSSGVSFTDALLELADATNLAVWNSLHSLNGTECELEDFCELVLKITGDIDFPRLRKGIKLEWPTTERTLPRVHGMIVNQSNMTASRYLPTLQRFESTSVENDEQWKLLLQLVHGNGTLSKKAVKEMFPERTQRDNAVRRLRELHLEQLQLTLKVVSGDYQITEA